MYTYLKLNKYLKLNFLNFKNFLNDMKHFGHRTICFNTGGSVIQGIEKYNEQIFAYADPRKGKCKLYQAIIEALNVENTKIWKS